MLERDIPPKMKEAILEHLAVAEYSLLHIKYLLKKLGEKRGKKRSLKLVQRPLV